MFLLFLAPFSTSIHCHCGVATPLAVSIVFILVTASKSISPILTHTRLQFSMSFSTIYDLLSANLKIDPTIIRARARAYGNVTCSWFYLVRWAILIFYCSHTIVISRTLKVDCVQILSKIPQNRL